MTCFYRKSREHFPPSRLPVLHEFFKQYHTKSTKVTRRKYTNLFPCIYDIPYITELGTCTLLKRTRISKMKYSTPTTVIFMNFSKYELDITVASIATTVQGCGVGIMGNNITMDISKTEPRDQMFKLEPVLHNKKLVDKVKDPYAEYTVHADGFWDEEGANLPRCIAASAALVDPYSHAYYLTVKVNAGDKRGEKLLMKNFIHSSSCDVIFNDDNIDRIFN
jgi:hypothetical protein